jgi:putative acetyltransferase
MVGIREMQPGDLTGVGILTNSAFGGHPHSDADPTAEPVFSPLLFETRLASDPAGCFVATDEADPAQLCGALFSVARGTLGWFGPLAVDPAVQRAGIGAALVARCVESWQSRGVALMGLETFGDSEFHVRFYGRFGFRPAWTGVTFSKDLTSTGMPAGVTVGGTVPNVDFIYPGMDVVAEARATAECGAGAVVTDDDGVGIVHLRPTFQEPGSAFLPFSAATDRRSFHRLVRAAEHLAGATNLTSMVVRVPGSAHSTMDALDELGYRAGSTMVRMKRGDDLDYDRGPGLYADNWL